MTFESLAPKDGTLRGAVVASLCLANDSGAVANPVGRHRCRAVIKKRWAKRGFLGRFFRELSWNNLEIILWITRKRLF